MHESKYSFEDLEVWKKSVDYACRVIAVTNTVNTDRRHYRLIEQLEASVVSISSNIAEGKGRFSKKEFIQYLYIARGSLYECVTQLIIFHRNGWISDDTLQQLKEQGSEIGKMLSSLISAVRKTT